VTAVYSNAGSIVTIDWGVIGYFFLINKHEYIICRVVVCDLRKPGPVPVPDLLHVKYSINNVKVEEKLIIICLDKRPPKKTI